MVQEYESSVNMTWWSKFPFNAGVRLIRQYTLIFKKNKIVPLEVKQLVLRQYPKM